MFKVIICPPCMLQLCDLQFCCFTAKYCSILLGTGPSRFGAGSVVTVVADPFWISWLRIRLQRGRPGFYPWVGKIPWRRKRLPTPVFWLGVFHGLYSPWNPPGQKSGVGSLFLLQGIFPTQGSNPGLPLCRQILYQLSRTGSPKILEWVAYPFCSRSSQPRN